MTSQGKTDIFPSPAHWHRWVPCESSVRTCLFLLLRAERKRWPAREEEVTQPSAVSQPACCPLPFHLPCVFSYMSSASHSPRPPLCLSALKRSFEVEEVEPPNSTPARRVQTPLLRSTVASSTQKFQDLGVKNSEPAARHVDSLSQRSPKPSLRRVELSGPKASEPVSRRTELSIDISPKQVENTGAAGPSRFGLKRAEVLGHKTPEPAPRRTEITIVKPQEPAHRRMEAPASKIPEVPAAPVLDAAPKRVEIQVPKPAEAPTCPLPPQILENSEPPMPQLQSRLEPKPPVAEAPPRSQEGE
jgi:septin 3/9/12